MTNRMKFTLARLELASAMLAAHEAHAKAGWNIPQVDITGLALLVGAATDYLERELRDE